MPRNRNKKTSFYRRVKKNTQLFLSMVHNDLTLMHESIDADNDSMYTGNSHISSNISSAENNSVTVNYNDDLVSSRGLQFVDNLTTPRSNMVRESDSDDESLNESNLDSVVIPNNIFEENENLEIQLRNWSLTNNITHLALGSLLKILNSHLPGLPLDPRTLLKTPRQTLVKIVNPGVYYHFGLETKVLFLLQNTKDQIDHCKILVNIDGLPLTKSSGSQFYPILISLYGSKNYVTLVGIYHGTEKPDDSNVFLRDLVDEAISLTNNGIIFKDKRIPFCIIGFVCDAPAKSFVRCTKGHTGYNSCTKCCQVGSYINRAVCFAEIDFVERTDNDFILQKQEEHHNGTTIITEIPNFGLVTNFPLDYMHLICLGVVKKLLLNLWCCGKPPYRLSSVQMNHISESLLSQKDNVPIEFCRKPRSLKDLKRWKATEFRFFLLYIGPVILKPILKKKYYLNFMALHVATTILSNPKLDVAKMNYAHSLMIYFVKTFSLLYGAENISHNVHNLLHLANDVRTYGCLDKFSAFPFENYMQFLKKVVRKSDKPIQQVVRRFTEIEEANINVLSSKLVTQGPYKEHNSGPLVQHCFSPQYSEYRFSSFVIKCIAPNNCCGLNDGTVIIVENIATSSDEQMVVIGRKFNTIEDYFFNPCKSSFLKSFKVSNLGRLDYWPINSVMLKYVRLSFSGTFVIIPLLHIEN